MPLYEYVCKKCGERFEALARPGEKAACERCGSHAVEKLLSPFAAVSGGSRPPCAEGCPHAAPGAGDGCACGCGGHCHGH